MTRPDKFRWMHVYRIDAPGAKRTDPPLYVGQTMEPKGRLKTHRRRFPGCSMTILSRHWALAAGLLAEYKAFEMLRPTHCNRPALPYYACPIWKAERRKAKRKEDAARVKWFERPELVGDDLRRALKRNGYSVARCYREFGPRGGRAE